MVIQTDGTFVFESTVDVYIGSRSCNVTSTCFSNPCLSAHCSNIAANALCVPNYCNHCSDKFYDAKGHDVTAMCSE